MVPPLVSFFADLVESFAPATMVRLFGDAGDEAVGQRIPLASGAMVTDGKGGEMPNWLKAGREGAEVVARDGR